MLITLRREEPRGKAVFGRLVVDGGMLAMDTLENLTYAIPDGFYRVRMTYSPRFQEVLPLLDGVYGYAVQNGSAVVQNGSTVVQNGSAVVQNGSKLCSKKTILNNIEREALNNIEREALNNIEREALNNIEREALNNTEREALNNIEREALNNIEREALNNVEREALNNIEREALNNIEREALNNIEREALNNIEPRSCLRTGIRIHAGNTIEHTEGCILVGDADQSRLSPLTSHLSPTNRLLSSRRRLNELRNYLLTYQKQNPYEEVYVRISSPSSELAGNEENHRDDFEIAAVPPLPKNGSFSGTPGRK